MSLDFVATRHVSSRGQNVATRPLQLRITWLLTDGILFGLTLCHYLASRLDDLRRIDGTRLEILYADLWERVINSTIK
jgi:hypothetical protein